MTLEELTDKARKFARFYSRHAGAGRDPSYDEDDLTQEAILAVWRHGLLDADDRLVALVIRNAIKDHIRLRTFGYTQERGRQAIAVPLHADRRSHDPTSGWDDALECERIIATLTEQDRDLLATTLRIGGLRDLAHQLGITKSRASARRRRLLQRLRSTAA